MFSCNAREKKTLPAKLKPVKSVDTSADVVATRFAALQDRAHVVRLQAANELEWQLTNQPPRWFGEETTAAQESEDLHHIMPYVKRVVQSAASDVEEADVAIRIAVATLLHYRGSDPVDCAELLSQFIAFNRLKEDHADAVTTALDGLALLSAVYPRKVCPVVAKLIDDVNPAEQIESVFCAFLTLAALGATEDNVTGVRHWILHGVSSPHSHVLVAALEALVVIRERFDVMMEPSLLEDANRAAPSCAADQHKHVALLLRALASGNVHDEHLTLDFSSGRRGRVVELVISGSYPQMVLRTLREFVKGAVQWYIGAVPEVAAAIGQDFTDIQRRGIDAPEVFADARHAREHEDEESDRKVRKIDREKVRHDARDAKSRLHEGAMQ